MRADTSLVMEAYRLRIISCNISDHSCCNWVSKSWNSRSCRSWRFKWSHTCSINDKYGDRVGQRSVATLRRESLVTLAMCGRALSCWNMAIGSPAFRGDTCGCRISWAHLWALRILNITIRGVLMSSVMVAHTMKFGQCAILKYRRYSDVPLYFQTVNVSL